MWTYVLLSIFVMLVLAWAFYWHDRSSSCFKQGKYGTHDAPFCTIKKMMYALPEDVRSSILLHVDSKHAGKRVEIPKMRSGRTMMASYVTENIPELVELYNRTTNVVGQTIGTPVSVAPLSTELSLSVIVYEKERDGIEWHYDDNYFQGRFFTVLIPVTVDDTCTVFQFRNHLGQPQNVRLEPGEALLFEGSKLLHRATPLCDGQRRVIISMQFTTDPKVRYPWLMKLKEYAFQGLRFW